MFVEKWGSENKICATSGILGLIMVIYMVIVGEIGAEAIPFILMIMVAGVLMLFGSAILISKRSEYPGRPVLVGVISIFYGLSLISFGTLTLIGLEHVFRSLAELLLYVILFIIGGFLSVGLFAFISYVAMAIHLFSVDNWFLGVISIALAILIPISFAVGIEVALLITMFCMPLAESVFVVKQ